eukprot:5896451-Prymnesium_polylepis.1
MLGASGVFVLREWDNTPTLPVVAAADATAATAAEAVRVSRVATGAASLDKAGEGSLGGVSLQIWFDLSHSWSAALPAEKLPASAEELRLAPRTDYSPWEVYEAQPSFVGGHTAAQTDLAPHRCCCATSLATRRLRRCVLPPHRMPVSFFRTGCKRHAANCLPWHAQARTAGLVLNTSLQRALLGHTPAEMAAEWSGRNFEALFSPSDQTARDDGIGRWGKGGAAMSELSALHHEMETHAEFGKSAMPD